ncbi:MAG: hypothetical protein AAFX85_09960, partial [Pseudomonadota bacterium]
MTITTTSAHDHRANGLPQAIAQAPRRTLGLLSRAKRAYSTRRVNLDQPSSLLQGADVVPQRGDLVLARIAKLSQHGRLHLVDGRPATLFKDDTVIVAYGDRYAPDQFEALLPESLETCHLAAGGGLAAKVVHQHARMKSPTVLEPLGILVDTKGTRINLRDYALPAPTPTRSKPPTFAVFGSSMNAGKTTTVGCLIRGLSNAGLRVGAAKVTGTGAGGDPSFMRDAGAAVVLDFVDAGYASTYRLDHKAILDVHARLVGELATHRVDALVLEIADGIFQKETAALLRCPQFKRQIDGVLFAAGDALGAKAGIQAMREHDLPLAGLSGVLSASPLAAREAEAVIGLPVLTRDQLCSATTAEGLFNDVRAAAWRNAYAAGSSC